MKKIFYSILVLLAFLVTACKKDKKVVPPTDTTKTKPTTALDLIKDSVFLYAKEDYLWNTQLPTYAKFNPRGFSEVNDLDALTDEVNAISQIAINPTTNKPYEYYANDPGQAKYSFIDNGAVSQELNGIKGDFGFDVQYNAVSDLRVEYVYAGSPAGIAGLGRGSKITSINGSTNIDFDGVAGGVSYGDGSNLNFVSNAIYNSGTISMTATTLAGKVITVNISTANYNINPVLKDTVITTSNNHKIGYVVFNSFTSDQNADPVLNAAFSNFATQGVTDVVVDLRYNGGGYVSTAEYIDNLIVPQSKNGTLMYNTYYNNNLVTKNDPLLHNQWRVGPPDYNYGQFSYTVANNAVNFDKSQPGVAFNTNGKVTRVFFIVTDQTASASELTINNLRPEMDVQLIGTTSYGKPVGFFDIDINKYEMFIPEFSVQNSAGQGGYYAGFTPGDPGYAGFYDYDDLTKGFGDPTEGLFADIVTYVSSGAYPKTPVAGVVSPNNRFLSLAAKTPKGAMLHNKNKFTGMVFNTKLSRNLHRLNKN